MADPQIKFKRSSVALKRPSLDNVATGEFAINVYDGNLFTRVDTGGVGIATTVSNLTPWTENFGGESITYTGIQTSDAGASTTDYSEVTLSGLSPSSFNTTYVRQTTGFVLDTGTVSSGNALFHADSNYYYYVASAGTNPNGRVLIYSEEDSSWVVFFDMSGNHSEGNVSENDTIGSGNVFNDLVTSNSTTADGRNVPTASGSIVYSTSGGGITTSRVGVVTITTSGDAIFAGVVTATEFYGDGSNLTGISAGSTANVVTDSLKVIGLSTFSGNLNLGDDVCINVGDSSDLKIYHDGDHSYVSDEGQGNLKFRSNAFKFTNVAESKTGLVVNPPTAVEAYFNGSKKLETTNDGVIVTGVLTATSFVGDGSGLTNVGMDTSVINSTQIQSGIITATSQFYPPSLTTTERDAITFSTGAFIFNETENKLQVYLGSAWASLTVDIDPYSIINM